MQYLRYEVCYTKGISYRRTGITKLEDAKYIALAYRIDKRNTDVKIVELTITEREIEF